MPFLEMTRPKLTTVRVQQHEAGRIAAGVLLRLIKPSPSDDVPVETVLPVALVVRDSAAPPRGRTVKDGARR